MSDVGVVAVSGTRRNFFDDVLTMLASRIVVQIAGLITSVIVARALGAEGRGLLAAVIFAPQLLMTVGAAGLANSAAVHIRRDTWSASDIAETMILVAAASIAVGMAFSFGWILVSWEQGYSPLLVMAAVMIVPGAVLSNFAAGILLGTHRIPTYAIRAWGPGVGKLFLTIVFVVLMGLGAEGAVAAIALSSFIVGCVLIWKASRVVSIRPRWRKEIASTIGNTGFALSFMFLMMILVYRANIVLIQKFGTLEQLGIYSLGAMLAELLWQIPTVVSGLLIAKSAGAVDGEEFARKVARLARLTLLVGGAASLLIALVIPFFVVLLYGREFAMSADVVRALLPGTLAIMVFKTLRQDLSGKGKPWAALWIVLSMLFATVVAGVFVIPVYGAIGAAYATSVIYVIGTACLILVYSRTTGIPVMEMVRYRKSDFAQVRNAVSKRLKKRRSGRAEPK